MVGVKGEKYIDKNGNLVLTGGLKAAATNKARHGKDFYREIGRRGGMNGKGPDYKGGFAANPALAAIAGRKGGRISKRGPAKPKSDFNKEYYFNDNRVREAQDDLREGS